MSILSRMFGAFLLIAMTSLSGCHSADDFGNQPERLIEHARVTFQSMMSDGRYPGLVDLASRARAIIIIPNQIRGAFFLGGRSGNAVMLVRDQNNSWSNPGFYTLGGINFGLQFGGQASEIVITVMTERGVNAVLDRQATLGADAGIAVGELGKGLYAATGIGYKSDMYTYARSEGLFVGVSLEGAVITPRHTWNQGFYKQKVKPRDILVSRTVQTDSPAAAALVAAMP